MALAHVAWWTDLAAPSPRGERQERERMLGKGCCCLLIIQKETLGPPSRGKQEVKDPMIEIKYWRSDPASNFSLQAFQKYPDVWVPIKSRARESEEGVDSFQGLTALMPPAGGNKNAGVWTKTAFQEAWAPVTFPCETKEMGCEENAPMFAAGREGRPC